MATLTVYPGMKPDGTRIAVLAQDLVTPIPNSGAVVGYSDYYLEKISAQILLTEDPVNSGGTPIQLLVPPLLVTGTPTAGQVLEATGASSATWETPTTGGPVDVNAYGVLPENDRITNDNALRSMRDQLLSADPNAHWTMVFGRRGTYAYSYNKWLAGFLDYTVDLNGSTLAYYFPEGWNVTTDTASFFIHSDFAYLVGETYPGYNWYQNGGYMWDLGFELATVQSGSLTVTVTSSLSDLPYLLEGDPVLICGWNPSLDSYPPPYQFFEYNEVLSVAGSVVTLRNRTKHTYKSTWHYSTIGSDPHFGRAHMFQLRGRGRRPAVAASNVIHPDVPRNGVIKNGTIQGTWDSYDYGGGRDTPHFFTAAYRSLLLENLEVNATLQIYNTEQVTMRKVRQSGDVLNSSVGGFRTCEIDKNCVTITIEDCRLGYLGGAANVHQLTLRNTIFEGRAYPQAQNVVVEGCSFGQDVEGSIPLSILRKATIRRTRAGDIENIGWLSCPEFVNSTGQAFTIATLASSNTHVTFTTTGAHANFALPRGHPFQKGDYLMKTDGAYYGRVVDCFYPNTFVVRWSSTPTVGHQFQMVPDWDHDYDSSSGDGRWPSSMPRAKGGSLTLRSRDVQNYTINRFYCPSKITSFVVNVTKAGTGGAWTLWVRVYADDGGQTLMYIDLSAAGTRTVTAAGITGSAGGDYAGGHAGTWANLSTWRPRIRFDSYGDSALVSDFPIYTLQINCEELAF